MAPFRWRFQGGHLVTLRVCAQRPVCVGGRGRLGGSFGRVGARVRARAGI